MKHSVASKDGKKLISVSEERLADAIVCELLDYFRDPSVSGVLLREHQALYIAREIIYRVLSGVES